MLELLFLLETEEDRIIFQDIYENTYYKFLQTALGILHNEHDAEETVHDIYVRIADNFSYYRNKTVKQMLGLGIVMTRNECIDIIRRRERRGEVSFEQNEYVIGQGNVLDEVVKKETMGELAVAFRELSQKERDILILKYFYNMTYKEISVTLGIQEKTVDIRLYRAKSRLRDFMTDPMYYHYRGRFVVHWLPGA